MHDENTDRPTEDGLAESLAELRALYDQHELEKGGRSISLIHTVVAYNKLAFDFYCRIVPLEPARFRHWADAFGDLPEKLDPLPYDEVARGR